MSHSLRCVGIGALAAWSLAAPGAAADEIALPRTLLPMFRRDLSLEERTYFGGQLVAMARVVADSVPCEQGWRSPARGVSLDQPESLARNGGRFSDVGIVPLNWWVLLQCGDCGSCERMGEIEITLSAEPVSSMTDLERLRGGKVIERSKDHVLVARPEEHSELVVGAFIDGEAESAPARGGGGLSPARAATFSFTGAGDPAAVMRLISPARVLVELAAVPRPTPAAISCAVGMAEPATKRLTDNEKSEQELLIYGALLRDTLRSGTAQVIEAETETTLNLASPFHRDTIALATRKQMAEAAARTPCLFESTLWDFARRASVAGPLTAPGHSPPGWLVLPHRVVDEPFRGGPAGWDHFRELYPGSNGIVTFSRAGFSRDGTQAMVFAGHTWGGKEGAGALYLMRRTPEGWRVLYTEGIWAN